MSLAQAQLEKRVKELDAREAFIDAKQKILDDAPINLKVFEATQKAHETRLKELIDLIKDGNNQLEEIKSQKAKESASIDTQKARLQRELYQLKDELKTAQEGIKKAQASLKDIKDEIKEADEYRQDQVRLMDESIEAGNEKLLDLKFTTTELENGITQLKKDKTALQLAVDDLSLELIIVRGENEKQIKAIEELVKSHQVELSNVIKSVTDKNKELTAITSEIDKKLMSLKEKETSLLAKQDSVRLEKQELDTEKRRFYSTKSLYDSV